MARHVELSGRLHVAAPLDRAVVFFTPEGERQYVAGWDPEYLHPADGALVEGLTFRTTHNAERTLWLISRCDIATGRIEYIRVVPESRIGVVAVALSPSGSGTEVSVTYRMTALSAAGEAALRTFAAGFDAMIASWERSIAAVLE